MKWHAVVYLFQHLCTENGQFRASGLRLAWIEISSYGNGISGWAGAQVDPANESAMAGLEKATDHLMYTARAGSAATRGGGTSKHKDNGI